MTIAVSSLMVAETASRVLSRGLAIASALGLPVTSWRVGDPTRTSFEYLAEILAARESIAVEHVKASWLSTAEGDWLTLLAREVYGVERVSATYAAPSVTLTNSGGGYYPIEPGDITVRSTATGQTYHNTSGGTLSAGTTITLDFVADAPGSSSSVAADDIDELVTTLLGVSIVGSGAAVGTDEQLDEPLRAQCRATLGALSPSGPRDAYEYVARAPDLTGTTEVTRATSSEDSVTGDVQLYVAGAAGAVSAGAVSAVADAVEQWTRPLTVTATVASATAVPVTVAATVRGSGIPATYADDAEAAVVALLGSVRIGGLLARSAIVSELHRLLVDAGVASPSVTLSSPAADVTLGEGEVPTLGSFAATVVES